jgi:hypothetical protein
MALGEVLTEMGSVGLRDIVAFPVWWYTKGIFYLFEKLSLSARRQSANFAVALWAKNLFVPMYGQYDWQGRIISFVVRLVQVIFRSLALGIWMFVLLGVALFYVFAPVVFVTFLFLHANLAV